MLNLFLVMHYLIYKITNTINGKFYIGKHKTSKLDDTYFGSGKHLKNAINKYGAQNFVFEILIDLNNYEEMTLLERMVVNEDFISRCDTYNEHLGGDGGFAKGLWKGRKRSVEDNLKKSIRMKTNNPRKGKVGTFKGRRHTDIAKLKNSIAHKSKKLSDEAKKKMSCSHKGKNDWSKGRHWFNNGITNVVAVECPIGFTEGRIKKKS